MYFAARTVPHGNIFRREASGKFERHGAAEGLSLTAKVSRCLRVSITSGEDELAMANRNRLKRLVDVTGIEPVTPCLQSRCSPS